MPTVTYSFKDLSTLIGKKISQQQLETLLEYAKAEVERFSGDEVMIKFNDTNQPYLWPVEGMALFLQGLLGAETGIPVIKLSSTSYEVKVEKSVKGIRPHISAFVVKGMNVSEQFLLQLVQSQEKIADTFGRRREKIAIGVYPSKKISFPVTYKAIPPRSAKFVPLGSFEIMTLQDILQEHPKGKEYGKALAGMKKYPILIDASRNILSFPPIINSSEFGRVEIGETELFFEATGTEEESVDLVASIFAHLFHMRGGTIHPARITGSGRSKNTPLLKPKLWKIQDDIIEKILGVPFSEKEKKELFRKIRSDYSAGKVSIPSYRGDIMHQVDLVEDLAIAKGYNTITSLPLISYTLGNVAPLIPLINRLRSLTAGAGFQEIFSQMLTSEEILCDRMNIQDFGSVKISNFSSTNYSVVRSWILPQLLEFLSKNKHVSFPQKVFEQGIVAVQSGEEVKEYERIAMAVSHSNVDFTELKRTIEFILEGAGVEPLFEEFEHKSFIPGRAASINVKGQRIAFIGEIHPTVLLSFGLEMPVTALELNITLLAEAMKK